MAVSISASCCWHRRARLAVSINGCRVVHGWHSQFCRDADWASSCTVNIGELLLGVVGHGRLSQVSSVAAWLRRCLASSYTVGCFNFVELLLGIVVLGGSCTSTGASLCTVGSFKFRRVAAWHRRAQSNIAGLLLGLVGLDGQLQYRRAAAWQRRARRATSDFGELLLGIVAHGWQFLIEELLPGIVVPRLIRFRVVGRVVVFSYCSFAFALHA